MANYLYNGVELPPLPEWDKKKYPFAMVDYYGYTETYNVWFFSEQIHLGYLGIIPIPEGTSGMKFVCSDSVWELSESWEADSSPFAPPTRAIWTNYDYLASDGVTVEIAASYPINAETGEEIRDYAPTPILAPTIDPLSMWLGWKAGNWVARQRGKAKQQWETLFDGTVAINEGAAATSIGTSTEISLSKVDTIRLTVNGKAETFTAKTAIINTVYVGNYHLWDSNAEDTGGDFCIACKKTLGFTYFVSRNAGTYSVKVEKAVST